MGYRICKTCPFFHQKNNPVIYFLITKDYRIKGKKKRNYDFQMVNCSLVGKSKKRVNHWISDKVASELLKKKETHYTRY